MYTKKTSVLVVDDDPRILRLLSRNLEMAGYQALSARDGWRALEQIEAKEPGLVLLDITMNGLNGFEVCRRLRAPTGRPQRGGASMTTRSWTS